MRRRISNNTVNLHMQGVANAANGKKLKQQKKVLQWENLSI